MRTCRTKNLEQFVREVGGQSAERPSASLTAPLHDSDRELRLCTLPKVSARVRGSDQPSPGLCNCGIRATTQAPPRQARL